jgi:hypothetical protein
MVAPIAAAFVRVAACAVILGFNYDTGGRYLSTPEFFAHRVNAVGAAAII